MPEPILTNHLAQKCYYSIGEVAQLLQVSPAVLRYWEHHFFLKPKKSQQGHRRYQPKDLEKLQRIHDLIKKQGHTIAGTKLVLKQQGNLVSSAQQTVLQLQALKTFLVQLQAKLTS